MPHRASVLGIPPSQPDKKQWAALHRELLAAVDREGLSAPTAPSYMWRSFYVTFIYAVSWGALCFAPSWPERLVLIAAATFAVMQSGLMAHDIAHRNLSLSRPITRGLGQYFMSFLGGQAYAHWESQHLGHHRHTQEAHDDPDLDVDLFALSHAAAARKTGFARFTTRWQGWLLWPAVTLQAFAIRVNSVRFLLRRRALLDGFFFGLHFVMWLVVPALFIGPATALLNYLLLTWFTGPCLSASFIWNHVGTASFESSRDGAYMAQRVLGSRNLKASPVYSLFFGGLNFHIEHHLAPHVPPARLAAVRPLLDAVLAKQGMVVKPQTFVQAMREVFAHVHAVGESLAVPATALSTAAETQPSRGS